MNRMRGVPAAILVLLVCVVLSACLGNSRDGSGSETNAVGSGEPGASGEPEGKLTAWTIPLGDDERAFKAYIKEFEGQYPKVKISLSVVPEEGYGQKINTAMQAHKPPDVALIEPDQTGLMKAGRVVELTQSLKDWDVPIDDFSEGGLARMSLENDPAKGVYAVGDFLAGNVLVYNKKLFDEAGVPYPPADRSLTFQEYDENCRKLARPSDNPAERVFGCVVPDWGFFYPVFGPDGHKAEGAMNSPELVNAFNMGSALIREGMAPGSGILETMGESDLFAENKIAITWTDFTETPKYQENKIDFGLAPFYVVEGQEDFVDTWTTAWGTFTESQNKAAAMAFLKFLATDAQRRRPEVSADPPLRKSIAEEVEYGKGDPVKEQYLEVLKNARRGPYVPPGVEAWDPGELMRQLTVENQTDAKQMLDEMARKSDEQLPRAWKEWEDIGSG